MTGTLALIGGDPFETSAGFNQVLVEQSDTSEVVLLPTAAAFDNPALKVARAIDHFAAFGVTTRVVDVLDRPQAMDPANAADLRGARCVCLFGSSAMHARPTLLHTPVWEALVDAWQNGATVIGSDAGARVLCDPMVDDRGGAFTLGLGLIERVAVLTRWNEWSEDSLHRLHGHTNDDLAVIAIDVATAVIRDPQGSWRSVGEGRVEVRLGDQVVRLEDLVR